MKNILEIGNEPLKIISCKQLKKLEQLKTTLKNIKTPKKTSKYINVFYLTNTRGENRRKHQINIFLFSASFMQF